MELFLSIAIVSIAFVVFGWIFLRQDEKKRQAEYRLRAMDLVLPNRLQAYERMSLYLDRISPENMVLREQFNVSSGKDLMMLLSNSVRQEFEHNVAMQIYVSAESWSRILRAKEEVVKTLNEASKGISPNCTSVEYGAEVIEHARNNSLFYVERAKDGLRKDLNGAFVNL